jgi:outer membrane protein OmpA-like peptidoglycan-associated protein
MLFPDKTSIIHIDLTEHNELNREGIDTLDLLARLMSQRKEIQVLVKGYSGSSTENKRYNKKMSEFTANIVKGFLVGKGVTPQRIETTGSWPVNPEGDETNQILEPNTRWVKIQLKNS